jgi:hypothetical protein
MKDEGLLLHKYSILGEEESSTDDLMSGFLSALNNFAKDLGWPSGVSLIRSGSMEARFSPGKFIFSVLIIDYVQTGVNCAINTESILSGLANEITEQFEIKYKDELAKKYFDTNKFNDFRDDIDCVINKYGKETTELYQKLVLIESMYVRIPQKYCVPLIERASNGEDVTGEFAEIIKKYPNMKKAIDKVNFSNAPVWEIFAIKTYEP